MVDSEAIQKRCDLTGYTVEDLRAQVQQGIDSGPSARPTMADVKAEARRRFEAIAGGEA